MSLYRSCLQLRYSEIYLETHISTKRVGTQKTPWVSREEGHRWRPACSRESSRPGPQTPLGVVMGLTLQHLRQRREFVNVAKKGRKYAAPGLVLQALNRLDDQRSNDGLVTSSAVRIGFTVTRKVGNAVVRNRVKRRLRAVASQIPPIHFRGNFDLVLVGRAETKSRSFEELKQDLLKALNHVEAYGADETGS